MAMATSSQSRLKKQQLLPVAPEPTKYYFAYGSNLHMRQMKKRCPNSKFIGRARLPNYRWQINERGYANVIAATGHWVDGLVFEVDETDEANLDIYEGVSKNAYHKCYIRVLLHRAQASLYRRPVAWIVDHGGPAEICKQAKRIARNEQTEFPAKWVDDVLTYLNLNCIEDSDPREEYVNRINLGIADARAVGVDADYIRNCIRPFIPETPLLSPDSSELSTSRTKAASPRRGRRGATPSQSTELAPARKSRTLSRPVEKKGGTRSVSRGRPKSDGRSKEATSSHVQQPSLPPRLPVDSSYDLPIIIVEEENASSWKWWPSF
ncbi:hypothetical protein PT974_09358 [Cladobotryum mycophilum]|uniref:gamma-glutamylcyclotransferase n=1 Tax=Cladobotryum mycophilum TaxID=491253 RepID=A0ABR0SGY5_9HYPO